MIVSRELFPLLHTETETDGTARGYRDGPTPITSSDVREVELLVYQLYSLPESPL